MGANQKAPSPMSLDEKIEAIERRAAVLAAKRELDAGFQRRAALSAGDFRREAEAAWSPLRDAVYAAVSDLDARLKPHGYRVVADERTAEGSFMDGINVQVVNPRGGREYGLSLTPVAVVPGHVSFSGPRGNVTNGNQGNIDLFTATPEQVVAIAVGYVEQAVR